MQNQHPLLLMEAKDFSLGVLHREKFNHVPMAVAIKARDTVAGIVGGSHCASGSSELAFFTDSRQKLKRHLSWLTRDVAVVGLDDYDACVPDLAIRHV